VSWARFGSNSEVYIFEDVRGGITCCACSLEEKVNGYHADFNCDDDRTMHWHVIEHAKSGHLIPDYLRERIQDESTDIPWPKRHRVREFLRYLRREIVLQYRLLRYPIPYAKRRKEANP
jgi:hypothetical protein